MEPYNISGEAIQVFTKYGPLAFLKNIGLPSIFLNALTGELTPPGICNLASLNNLIDLLIL